MKPKTSGTRGRPPKQKIVKKELTSEDVMNLAADYQIASPGAKPSVQISQCISYQKFRYSGENRPGKKYQEKEFMTLKLSNLYEKVVRVVIICTDADNRELIHPNGLVGRDCHDGIYDKDYSITKASELIKIPYLRIERIKTKRNEHKKIQSVLQQRALHLPSPYKERCLSQCSDNYTANRRFDTTKVCLGVIVTVISHQRNFNGFLHAISHVVRNANAKTKMGILKLSEHYVPASTGGEIDIFTTEEGPAIEPDKYLVSVSYEGPLGNWTSEKVAPSKEDILYKRVIRYMVPPFEPKVNLDRAVHATLHLECPQSNQYCGFHFAYSPPTEYMIIEDNELKRSLEDGEEEDRKISPKRAKYDEMNEEKCSESINANLKTMLQAKQDYPSMSGEPMALSHSFNGSEGYMVHSHDKPEHRAESQILVTHVNPQTGESSVLLDMDGGKSSSNPADNSQYSFQNIPLDRLKDASFKQIIHQAGKEGEQEVQVVAAGYSDAVPPNTVYIYTTNGGRGEPVTIDNGEHIVLQEVTDEESVMITDASNLMRDVTAAQENQLKTGQFSGPSEQVVRRDTVGQQSSAGKGQMYAVAKPAVQPSIQSQSGTSSLAPLTNAQGKFVSSSSASTAPSSLLAGKFSSPATSSSSAIPQIRRMLIPSKVQSSSPWAVEGDEDSAAAYSIVVSNEYGLPQTSAKVQYQPQEKIEIVKAEPLTDKGFVVAEQTSGNVVLLDSVPQGVTMKNIIVSQEQATSEKNALATDGNSNKSKLTPLEFHLKNFVADADNIAENLPTIQVAEFVKDFETEKDEVEENTEKNSKSDSAETAKN